MNIHINWIEDQLPWIKEVPQQELVARVSALGHQVDISADVWTFYPRSMRPDLNGVNGILREISAAFGKSFPIPQPQVQDDDMGSVYESLDADVWSDTLCNRFTAKMGVGLKAGKTPDWIQQRLTAAGIVCCNNICDIANYVFLEYGQPILLLDAQAVFDGTIALREAFGYETAEDAVLPYGVPILESGEEIIAVPNYWTSPKAVVNGNTESVIIAAVNYPPDVISLCDETFGESSDEVASQDPLLTITATQRVCQLIQELGYGHILDGTIDILNYVPNPQKLDLQAADIQGHSLTQEEFSTFLSILGVTADSLLPSWRPDLDSPEAIASEIVRLYLVNSTIKD